LERVLLQRFEIFGGDSWKEIFGRLWVKGEEGGRRKKRRAVGLNPTQNKAQVRKQVTNTERGRGFEKDAQSPGFVSIEVVLQKWIDGLDEPERRTTEGKSTTTTSIRQRSWKEPTDLKATDAPQGRLSRMGFSNTFPKTRSSP